MTSDFDALAHGYLDGHLTDGQQAELNARLAADPAAARRFADLAVLHDRLAGLARTAPAPARPAAAPRRRVLLPGGLLAAAVLIAAGWWTSRPASVAAAQLGRLIDAVDAGDRTYRIRSLDAEPEPPDDRRPPLDGATLFVRHPDQYVLVRRFPDGRVFVTGSDGTRGWAVPPDGAVRVSHDPLRFRGPVPGHQHGLPFADLRSDLQRIRDAYALTTLGPDPGGLVGLAGEKRSAGYRGPRHVELWFDPRSGVVRRMAFDGLPKARGGPTAVAVQLAEQRDLGPDFFDPARHHGPDRRVIVED